MSERAGRHATIVGSIVNHFLFSELPGKSSFISDHQLYAETPTLHTTSSPPPSPWPVNKKHFNFSPGFGSMFTPLLSSARAAYCSEPVNYRRQSWDVWWRGRGRGRGRGSWAGPSHDSPSSPGWCPTSSSASIFLFPGLIFIQNFCQFIMVGNPASCLPTTTCLWFQGLTVFVIDIKLKENTNPRPTDHQVRTGKNNTNWAKASQKKAQSWVWICFSGWGGESGRSRYL